MEIDQFLQLHQLQTNSALSETTQQRRKTYRTRNSFDDMSDEDLRARFRFSRSSLDYLLEKLESHLPYGTKRNHALSNKQRLLLTLRVLASGSFLEVVGDNFGVDKATASRAFSEIISAILHLKDELIDVAFLSRSAGKEWFDSHHIPRGFGCIDGTHVRILAPKRFEEEFVNRKGYHSINVQIVTTGDLLIANCVAKWPGSTHDSKILTESAISQMFQDGRFGTAFLLGDQGYPQKSWLFTPVPERSTGLLTTKERNYNRAHKSARSSVERVIGILKRRWSCLSTGLRFQVKKCCKIIVACVILHNYAMLRNEPLLYDDLDIEENETGISSVHQLDLSNTTVRTLYINEHF